MKNFLKHFLTKNNIILAVVVITAAFIRLYNFPDRITFWTEQARSLVVSANYIHQKPSLLGQEYFRQDSNSHIIYSGALFNYSLIPLLFLAGYDPVYISLYFVFLNLATGLTVYYLAKKMFDARVAILSATLFLFNSDMIYHSLFIWNYNYLPLVGILLFYLCWKFAKHKQVYLSFVLGLISGIGVSLQYLFAPLAFLVLVFVAFKSKTKFVDLLLFLIGLLIPNLPLIIFDLRHNFYQSQTLVQYFIDTLKGKSDASYAYYYFLPFWPIFTVIGGYFLSKFTKNKSVLAYGLLIIYLYLNLTSIKIDFYKPTGMPSGIKIKDIDLAAQTIAGDATGDFNVAEVLDFDKRAYVLRYFSEFRYGKKPMADTDYRDLKTLYVLGRKGYNFEDSDVWEVRAGGKYKINLLSEVGEGYGIYKLTK